jgi:hypothetical protein
MKHLQFIGLIVFAALLIGCETEQVAGPGQGNQEQKRVAALKQQEQESAQMDEGDQNLWAAQQNRIDREYMPTRHP